MTSKLKDPVSAVSHMIGAVLSVIGLVLLVHRAVVQGTVWHIVAFSVYGASLVLLYTASSLYHAIQASERWNRILRKIDHSMIYVLIAGSYTPFCLISLRGPWGWSLLASIWGFAFVGIIVKFLWMGAPRWFSTLVYTVLGWLIIVALVPLIRAITVAGVLWLLAGGILYSAGAVIYGAKWPRIRSKVFGFHEVFHLFVLGGSIIHFWVISRFVLPFAVVTR